jgi:hypothetical protein
MFVALMFTHEGALVLALTIVATLALRSLRDASFMRGATAFIAALTVWVAVKLLLPPDEYFAGVLIRAALHFFDLAIFEVNLFLLLLAALTGYGFAVVGLSRFAPHKAHLCAAAVVIALLAVYWISFDHSIHANNRYYMRTALVIVTPALGALAVSYALYPEAGAYFDGPDKRDRYANICRRVYSCDVGLRCRNCKIRL